MRLYHEIEFINNTIKKLYWKNDGKDEIITKKETETIVYNNGKGLLDGEWVPISPYDFIEEVKRKGFKIEI